VREGSEVSGAWSGQLGDSGLYPPVWWHINTGPSARRGTSDVRYFGRRGYWREIEVDRSRTELSHLDRTGFRLIPKTGLRGIRFELAAGDQIRQHEAYEYW